MKAKLKNILFPTDFSEQNKSALNIAINLCKKNNAVLHLFHVVENRYIINSPQSSTSLHTIANEIDSDARSNLYSIYDSLINIQGIAVQIYMPTGIPYDEICKAAEEMPIDLIIIGTHGASGCRKFFMGTTAYNVIKNTTKPVLTMPGNYNKKVFQKILFPVRPVANVKEKLDFLLPLIDEKKLTGLHVAILRDDKPQEEKIDAGEELYSVMQLLEEGSFEHNEEIYYCENFADKVLELAERQAADIIVINATLDYKWTYFFVGPYTQQIVNHSRVPVLSYRNALNVPAEIQKEEQREFLKKTTVL